MRLVRGFSASTSTHWAIRRVISWKLEKSENFEKKAALSSIGFDSELKSEPTLIREKNENVLVGRDWIEENLNYERRHRITDDIVNSAADFRKQNKIECQAEGFSHGFQIFKKTWRLIWISYCL